MQSDDRIYVAGHRGLVGSALLRALQERGYRNLLVRDSSSLDLRDAQATSRFIEDARPEYVFLAAARVGGILANDRYPVEFLQDNLAIQGNVIAAAYRVGVRRLLFLGSSCIYPRLAAQPIREESLLTGPLEPTNRAYALAKIAGIELCWSYNREYGTRYLAIMPCNLYGPGDNLHPENSHVIPALMRRFHEAHQNGDPEVTIWGTGTPRREFLYSDDVADAALLLMTLTDSRFDALLASCSAASGEPLAPLINVGAGEDLSIRELAEQIATVVGYAGRLRFDPSRPDGTPRKLLDIERIRALGWKPRMGLSEGLARAYRDFCESSQRLKA